MATIKTLPNGRFHVRIQRRVSGAIVFDKQKRFDTRPLAAAWAEDVEAAIDAPGGLAKHANRMTFSELAAHYIARFNPIKKFGRTKLSHLNLLADSTLGDYWIDELDTRAFMDFADHRILNGTGTSTINQDFVWIRIVLRQAPAFGTRANLNDLEEAITLLRATGSATRPNKRTRRPTDAELWQLSDYFNTTRPRGSKSEYPMYDIMWFAIHGARRQNEITRLEKTDDNPEDKTGLVRDLKHPRHKQGNHQRFRYTSTAWDIAHAQTNDTPYHFPFNSKTIGQHFRKACRFCGIEDLRFHDLRHEATSRLFEDKLNIPDVAHITLHRTWENLRRYTHLGIPKQRLVWAPGKPRLIVIPTHTKAP